MVKMISFVFLAKFPLPPRTAVLIETYSECTESNHAFGMVCATVLDRMAVPSHVLGLEKSAASIVGASRVSAPSILISFFALQRRHEHMISNLNKPNTSFYT
jgi:hypothetical protein